MLIFYDINNISQFEGLFNSFSPSNAYTRQSAGSSLVQVMACGLFGAKLLPEPMLAYCHLDSNEQISVKFEPEFYEFHSRKCIRKCHLPNWWPSCPWGDELIVHMKDFGYRENTGQYRACWLSGSLLRQVISSIAVILIILNSRLRREIFISCVPSIWRAHV